MRHFSLEEANRLLPSLVQTFDRVRPLLEQLERLGPGERPRQEELLHAVRKELEPFVEMGVEVKAADGLVDFRALREGRTVYLCWRYGEERVTHWHELETGFAGRRPIASPSDFAPTYLS
jgi:hypothetical protein